MTYFLIDTTYLCHRAWYALGGLEHAEVGTGVIYGVMHDILNIGDQYGTGRFVWCFDHKVNLRKDVYPGYKSNREAKPPQLIKQIEFLRDKVLPRLGFRNILCTPGYEADDFIASSLQAIDGAGGDDAIMVTSDKDMYQLLAGNCTMHRPGKGQYTVRDFYKEYGIQVDQWAKVKAIAGCNSDCVVGVAGVGEKTAIKFLKRELKVTTKAHQSIAVAMAFGVPKANLPIVRLPYKGTPVPTLIDDECTSNKWDAVARKLGMTSLLSKVPAAIKRDDK